MSQEPFGDIPLFRELQRLMAAGDGPVNLELARQVADAVAARLPVGSSGGTTVARSFADAVHAVERLLSGYTRIPLVEPMTSQIVDRTWWIRATLRDWRWLLDKLADRLTAGFTGTNGEGADAMRSALGQITPILMGLQVGTLLGNLAREALGRYDQPVARQGSQDIFLVWPNADLVIADYDFDEATFVKWFATRDASRHLVHTGVAWVPSYHRSLVAEVVDSIEIDPSELERRLLEMQSRGIEGLQEGLSPAEAMPISRTPRHEQALQRLRAFLAVWEGYAQDAADAVVSSVAPDTSRIEEGMARRGASESEAEAMLGAILGAARDRQTLTSGRTFCSAVAELKGRRALNALWDAPDNLPTIDEIRDPFAWIERVVDA